MGIRENSKKIINSLLVRAVREKSLNHSIDYIDIFDLGKEANVDNSNEFLVCMDYIQQKGFVKVARTQDAVHITLTAAAIDFLEAG